jgi:hypothetical protein
MTRHLNPVTFFAELIAKAFATLDARDNAGGRGALISVLSRPRVQRSSPAPTRQAQSTPVPDGAGRNARLAERSGSMQRRRHTDAP